MKVLVVGGGGREHALAWKMAQAEAVEHVFVAPGNGGTALDAALTNVPITDVPALVAWAAANTIDLVVVGPEAPLAAGAVDQFRAAAIPVFGPTQAAAQLESSKAFSKAFMARHGIPTATFETFSDVALARAHIAKVGAPIVVKADGLAAGKGVVVAMTVAEALAAVDDMLLDNRLGVTHNADGARVVIEEFLVGEEASFIVVCDGKTVIPLATSQDHKRLETGDLGPNTGGMGAYSPLPWLPEGFIEEVSQRVAQPTITEMAKRGTPFVGLLYCGLIITERGVKVIEFNARFGDPETQVVLRRLNNDLSDLLMRAATGKLDVGPVATFSEDVAVTVVLASEGYPVSNAPVRDVLGIESAESIDGVEVCKASPTGRVLSVVGSGETFQEARTLAYEGMARISLEGGFYRHDIALRVAD